jgi:hypothetical protein
MSLTFPHVRWPPSLPPTCTGVLQTHGGSVRQCERSISRLHQCIRDTCSTPNPVVRDGMATPVVATGSKVRFARHSGVAVTPTSGVSGRGALTHRSASGLGRPPLRAASFVLNFEAVALSPVTRTTHAPRASPRGHDPDCLDTHVKVVLDAFLGVRVAILVRGKP